MRQTLAILGLIISQSAIAADDVIVAVASNFVPTAEKLVLVFEQETGHRARLSSGSSGKLYAQIINGAPYDVFLSADAERPTLLEQDGRTVFGTRFSYAIGELLLWARNVEGEGESCVDAFLEDRSSKVAIANPDTAPYGTAAKQYLVAAELWDDVSPRLVTGENIAQAFQFVSRGGAGFGFIAGAQRHALPAKACTWPVPVMLFDPIRQQAVLLNRAAEKQAAQAFMSFLQGGSARSIIVADAYAVEESSGE